MYLHKCLCTPSQTPSQPSIGMPALSVKAYIDRLRPTKIFNFCFHKQNKRWGYKQQTLHENTRCILKTFSVSIISGRQFQVRERTGESNKHLLIASQLHIRYTISRSVGRPLASYCTCSHNSQSTQSPSSLILLIIIIDINIIRDG